MKSIYEMLEAALDDFDDARHAGVQLARFELAMLAELGFGLDLADLRGHRRDRGPDLRVAEIRQRGLAQRRRALARQAAAAAGLPARRRTRRSARATTTCSDGFALTGMFLLRHVLEPRGQTHSDARDGFIAAVLRRRTSAVDALSAIAAADHVASRRARRRSASDGGGAAMVMVVR